MTHVSIRDIVFDRGRISRSGIEEDAMTRRAWRVAGVLVLGGVVLRLAGFLQITFLPMLGEPVVRNGVEGSMTSSYLGGFMGSVGLLLFLPACAFLTRTVGGRSEVGAWSAQTGFAVATAFVAVTFASGFAAAAAALYGLNHGADLATVTVVNNLHNFAFVLSQLLLAVSTAGFAMAILTGRVLRRWLGWSGLATAAALLASVPTGQGDLLNNAGVLWMVWFVALGIIMLTHRPAVTSEPALSVADRAAVVK